jgi:ParB-like chromosome segregation protein Spo0J
LITSSTLQRLSSLEVVERRLEELRPNPRNARTHRKRKIKDLAKGIAAFGFNVPIVTDETGMILAGHARYAAARLLGLQAVPTICLSGLSDDEKSVRAGR